MSDQPTQTDIDAATAYEGLFVPALFGEWAPRVAAAARIEPGQRVLDIGCGTGVLAKEVAARVGDRGRVAGVDPHLGMLAVAERLAPGIEWREVEVATHPGVARFPSIRALVDAEVRGWLPVMGVTLGEDAIERVLREAEDVLQPYVTARGAVTLDVAAHIVTAINP